MTFGQIGSPHPKYLAATDILIGDMSDTNYEFLLFERPVILLANAWLRENFADIGIKTDLEGLEEAIRRSVDNPDEYKEPRKYWLKKTIYKPDGHSSRRVLDTVIKYSKAKNPVINIIHGNDMVRKTNLDALADEASERKLVTNYVGSAGKSTEQNQDNIYIAAHFRDLDIPGGYRVHLDHGLKGKGTANVEFSMNDYKKNSYFPLINLHVTAGEVGQERTEMLLGPNSDRAVIAGYPKADDLIRLSTKENKIEVFRELGFNIDRPLITYAPAGEESYMKPGGSLSEEVIDKLKEIALKHGCNVLVKLKYPKLSIVSRGLMKLKRMITV